MAIHDLVVCRMSDVDVLREVMTDAYFKLIGHEPVIKQVW